MAFLCGAMWAVGKRTRVECGGECGDHILYKSIEAQSSRGVIEDLFFSDCLETAAFPLVVLFSASNQKVYI